MWENLLLQRMKKLKDKQIYWEKKKDFLIQKQKLKNEIKSFKKKMSLSKMLIIFLFVNCTIIEIFTGIVTLKSFVLAAAIGTMVDFSPLVALIGAVVGEVIGFAIYSLKAMKENCEGGVTYMNAYRSFNENPEGDEQNNG